MKKPTKVKPVVQNADALLTPGDRRGLAAAKKLAEKLKEKYAAEGMGENMPVHVSIMAGPVKKIR